MHTYILYTTHTHIHKNTNIHTGAIFPDSLIQVSVLNDTSSRFPLLLTARTHNFDFLDPEDSSEDSESDTNVTYNNVSIDAGANHTANSTAEGEIGANYTNVTDVGGDGANNTNNSTAEEIGANHTANSTAEGEIGANYINGTDDEGGDGANHTNNSATEENGANYTANSTAEGEIGANHTDNSTAEEIGASYTNNGSTEEGNGANYTNGIDVGSDGANHTNGTTEGGENGANFTDGAANYTNSTTEGGENGANFTNAGNFTHETNDATNLTRSGHNSGQNTTFPRKRSRRTQMQNDGYITMSVPADTVIQANTRYIFSFNITNPTYEQRAPSVYVSATVYIQVLKEEVLGNMSDGSIRAHDSARSSTRNIMTTRAGAHSSSAHSTTKPEAQAHNKHMKNAQEHVSTDTVSDIRNHDIATDKASPNHDPYMDISYTIHALVNSTDAAFLGFLEDGYVSLRTWYKPCEPGYFLNESVHGCVECTNAPENNTEYTAKGFPRDVDNCSWACVQGMYVCMYVY
jgi:hypothetical protein